MQLHVPDLLLDLVQSSGSDDPEEVIDMSGGLFRISFADIQTTLAIDEDVRDMR